jgi:DNA-binding LacI/PurR family transcriptional regulator
MPTLRDVARQAGVSTATVSKVLSNTPYFTEETRLRVLKAVEDLGYRPNLAARALSSGKTHIIAVVFPYVYEAIFTDPLVLSILQGVEETCYQRRYNMLLSTPRVTDAGVDEHYHQLIQSGYIEGVLAIDNVPLASVLRPALERGIPGVVLGYHDAAHFVRSSDCSGGQQLMRYVLASGHRHIGIVSVPEGLHFSIRERLKGLALAAADAGVDFAALPKVNGDFSIASGAACAEQLLTLHPQLTMLICLNDRMAMGAVQQARTMGRQVPTDLSVVGYDNIPAAATFSPALTTIDQQAPELGRAAAQMLFDLLDKKNPEPIYMPTQLIVRESSAQIDEKP